MTRLNILCGSVALAAFGLTTAARGADSGPCADDIANLRKNLSMQVGMGAPVSQPEAGLRKGPDESNQKTAENTTGTVGSQETDRSQPGGASREGGGSPGTVGGVAGPVGAATGQGEAVASGRIATSPADVRRQSENRPTTAAAAAQGQESGSKDNQEDKAARAKTALQRAVDLSAAGDKSCAEAVKEARELMPEKPQN